MYSQKKTKKQKNSGKYIIVILDLYKLMLTKMLDAKSSTKNSEMATLVGIYFFNEVQDRKLFSFLT